MSSSHNHYAASLLRAQDESDDDMDYHPATETEMTEDDDVEILEEIEEIEDDDDDDDEDGETEYDDAEEEITNQILEEMMDQGTAHMDEDGNLVIMAEGGDEEEAGEDATTEGQTAASGTGAAASQEAEEEPAERTLTYGQLIQVLLRSGRLRTAGGRQLGISSLFANDDDDDDDDYYPARRRGPQRQRRPHPPVDWTPKPEGQALMESGTFGVNDRQNAQFRNRKKVAARIMQRELGLGSPGRERCHNRLVSQELLPSSNADMIVHYEDRCYSGQFSEDGNFFFSVGQDFRVRMYDTSNPYSWKHYKTAIYPYGSWTLSDATLSPDNKYLAYSSLRHIVALANTDPDTESDPMLLDLTDTRGGRNARYNGRGQFAIFSLRFSGDGTEIVAGTNVNSLIVYDLESRKSILQIDGHDNDVNAVCYGDKSSPHILYSGSDDSTIKIWDRRSLGDGRPAGCFIGHKEGITYVDSKGDGRYVLSNGKDQTMKLWDLRKMHPAEKLDTYNAAKYMTSRFDYRGGRYEDHDYSGPHPDDCSVVTFRGHSVLRTLIRCHFSPPGSTDSRYVYTGSADGSVYVYNLDSTLAKKIDVEKATLHTRPPPTREDMERSYWGTGTGWSTCVRDVSWHPFSPVIAATSWNGYGGLYGTCTTHTWNDGLDEDEGEPKMGNRVDEKLRYDPRFYGQQSNRRTTRSMRRRFDDDEDDE